MLICLISYSYLRHDIHITLRLGKCDILLRSPADLPLEFLHFVLGFLVVQPLVLALLDGLPYWLNEVKGVGGRAYDSHIDVGHLLSKLSLQLAVGFPEAKGALNLKCGSWPAGAVDSIQLPDRRVV